MTQNIIFSKNASHDLGEILQQKGYDKVFVLTDETTERLCLPLLQDVVDKYNVRGFSIPKGDENKDIAQVIDVWRGLSQEGASRRSCMINLGGGMITDIGGFIASTFKRGIDFINVPTTLLSQVDAAVGGKTGINFNGLKNEIGVFQEAQSVILSTQFLDTLDEKNLLSGYAEMLKHALISNETVWKDTLCFSVNSLDLSHLLTLVEQSVEVKRQIVLQDPKEKSIRKALNFGHTIGHAIEAFYLSHGYEILHGYAVAWGMISELYLSHILTGFDVEKMRKTVNFIYGNYGRCRVTCKDYDELLTLMLHDKKNVDGRINFTLLSGIGGIEINRHASNEEIKEALDFLTR